jgi:glutamate transport system permease protein
MDGVIENLLLLWGGYLRTLALLGIAAVGSLVIGVVVAGLRLSPVAPMRTVATV